MMALSRFLASVGLLAVHVDGARVPSKRASANGGEANLSAVLPIAAFEKSARYDVASTEASSDAVGPECPGAVHGLIKLQGYCDGARKEMVKEGHNHGFGHNLASCQEAVLADAECISKRFDFSESYNGQCKCSMEGDCDDPHSHTDYNVYQAFKPLSVVKENSYCDGARKEMKKAGHNHGFGHDLASCAKATLADTECLSKAFDFSASYNGQCKCSTSGTCDKYRSHNSYDVYQAVTVVKEGAYCGGARKEMQKAGHNHGFGHDLASCLAATLADPECTSKRFDYSKSYNGQCKCALGCCSDQRSLAPYAVYEAA